MRSPTFLPSFALLLAACSGAASPRSERQQDLQSSVTECALAPCTIASLPPNELVQALAVDGENVYAVVSTLEGAAFVGKAPIGGGALVTLADATDPAPTIALDATSVYWAQTDGTIRSVGIDGRNPVIVASGQDRPQDIVVDGTNVYWTNLQANANNGTVMKASIAGGPAVTLATPDSARGIAIDSTNLYWLEFNESTKEGRPAGGNVVKLPLAGGEPVTLASEMSNAMRIAVNATDAYWTSYDHFQPLRTVQITGGADRIFQDESSDLYDVAVDGRDVYWTRSSSDLFRAPIGGGAPSLIARVSSNRFALGAASVYFATDAPQATLIQRLAKE